jgi:hypothetical protein
LFAVIPNSFEETPMKKLIAAAFALTLLGAGAAEALTIGIHTGGHHHRHCSWRHHHRFCR